MPPNLTIQILTILLSITPLSLGLIWLIQKLLLKQDKNFAEITSITTGALGILTETNLTVRSIIFDKYRIDLHKQDSKIDIFNHDTKEHTKNDKTSINNQENIILMAKIINFCHYPKIQAQENTIKKFFQECGINQEKFFREYRILDQLPVIPETKISSTVALEIASSEIFAFAKGHPLKILEQCKRILLDGKKVDLDKQLIQKLKKKITNQLRNGHKIIAFAYKGLPKKRFSKYENTFIENDLIFVGIIGLGHFIKPELKTPLKELRRLGIKIYLTAEDSERKSIAIANELGIIKASYFEAIDQEYLQTIDDHKLAKMLKNREKDYLFSNLQPKDKTRIVHTLEQNGEKVLQSQPENLSIEKILQKIRDARQTKSTILKIHQHAILTKIILLSITIPAIFLQAPLPFSIAYLLILELAINTPLELSLNQSSNKKSSKTRFQKILIIFIISLLFNAFYFWQLARFGWSPGTQIASTQSLETATNTAIAFMIITTIYFAHKINKTKKSNIFLNLTTLIALIIAFYLSNFQTTSFKIMLPTLLILYIIDKTIKKYVPRT